MGSDPLVHSYYIYDGNQIVLQFDGPELTDLTNRYLWVPGVDRVLADEQVDYVGGQWVLEELLWPLGDHLGTVRDLAEFDGALTTIANHIVYDSFGKKTSETNQAVDHLFAFTGRLLDQDTGLQNNLNRWYDAGVGRWLNEDPIGFTAGDPNLYRYVGNEPTTSTDPSGLQGIVFELTEVAGSEADARRCEQDDVMRFLLEREGTAIMQTTPARQWSSEAGALIESLAAEGAPLGCHIAIPFSNWIGAEQWRRTGTDELIAQLVAAIRAGPCVPGSEKMYAQLAHRANRERLTAVLDIVASTSVFPIATNRCHAWVAAARDRIVQLGKPYYDNDEYKITYVDWSFSKTKGHGGLRIDFKKTGLKGYFDNGSGGGIFMNKPPTWPRDTGTISLERRQRVPTLWDGIKDYWRRLW